MRLVRVSLMPEERRPALCRMLRESQDFPDRNIARFEHESARYLPFIAEYRDIIVGFLSGSVDSDFHQNDSFDSFDAPPGPHGFLDLVHVSSVFRRQGSGRQLVRTYAQHAASSGCMFVGGSIDLSSESSARRAFFERCGFTIREHDNFGALPGDVT
ncbi:GNAT family N-acetyltransferase [Nocardioides sp. URHA0020]|uniref:GNAT family N-acetyltransferase n=1 Tax=Nocardioides sp. URHA0020 TaxID=1380392 RepID=UPI00049078C2|nr:GNAT family N-acetyltransferase [Nocardioides sp. URHA0020]